ncbi:MAG: hypothetical protein IPI23_20550 [Bacteroidetes bacterium]|nr:hypothetical protein [Bacteroidota bacterium]
MPLLPAGLNVLDISDNPFIVFPTLPAQLDTLISLWYGIYFIAIYTSINNYISIVWKFWFCCSSGFTGKD